MLEYKIMRSSDQSCKFKHVMWNMGRVTVDTKLVEIVMLQVYETSLGVKKLGQTCSSIQSFRHKTTVIEIIIIYITVL